VLDLADAAKALLALLYSSDTYEPLPRSKNAPKPERNSEICTLYELGWSVLKLSAEFGISKARIYQILKAGRATRSR